MHRDVRDLLGPDEEVEREVEVGTARLVVTDRRLLAFTPETEGENYRAVDRPNVESVALTRRSDRGQVLSGVLYLLIGLGTVAAGLVVETDGLIGDLPTGPGAEAVGIAELVGKIGFWLGLVDDAIVVLGVIFALPALYHAVTYLRSRRSVLAIGVAGDEDIDLPTERVPEPTAAVERLRLALDLPTGEASEVAPEWTTGDGG